MSLNNHHLDMLAASGVTVEHTATRGYETITDKRWFIHSGLKITEAGRNVPGLLVPLLRVDGSTWGYQYRPDEPRLRGGKVVKYETPWQQRNGLDIPPGVGPMLADPAIPLWITEGVKKADCGALHGLCSVGLVGVYGWLGTNTAGGKMALPEWRDIALNGRRVVISFDGDIARKESVQKAAHALAAYLATKGARVEFLHLPDTDDKTGLDDYLMAGHTVEDLWSLVKPHQPRPYDKGSEPQQTQTPPKEPPPYGSIDGAALLDEIDAFLARYVIYPEEHMRHAHTLWIAHTHLMDCWDSTPRIGFLSPEPASGKTRALEVTEPLVPRAIHAVNVTPAYLFRKLSDSEGLPTILYDEIDTVFGPWAKENEDIRGMINAGHRNGAVAGRCVIRGKLVETEELPAYCAVMMAGLNDLPDTIMSRCVVVRMKRRAPSETVKPWRMRIDGPVGLELGKRLADWADSVRSKAKEQWPEMPDGVEDRDADAWEALLAVADLAGGHWPETSRVAAVAAVADSAGKEPSLGLMLLRDLRTVFSKHSAVALTTHELLQKLKGVEESPWLSFNRDGTGITARQLAKRLSPYGIESCDIRQDDGKVLKGYFRAAFTDAWDRYLPPDDQKVREVTEIERLMPGPPPGNPLHPLHPLHRRSATRILSRMSPMHPLRATRRPTVTPPMSTASASPATPSPTAPAAPSAKTATGPTGTP